MVLLSAACASGTHVGAGLDFGTSGVRIAIVEQAGPSQAPQPLFSASAPLGDDATADDWAGALERLICEVPAELRGRLTHIGISGTSATSLVVERDARPAAAGPCRRAVLRGPRRYDFSVTGLAVGESALRLISQHAPEGHTTRAPTSSLAKLVAWHLEQPLGPDALFCHQADFLASTLVEPARPVSSDWHNALKLGFDVADGGLRYPDWLAALLAALGPAGASAPLDARALPRVVPPGTALGEVSADVARRLGLPPTCKVCAGTTDSNAAFFAATGGKCAPGVAVTSLGSTIALKLLSDTRADDAALGLYSHRLGDRWLVGGASNCGCAVLREHFTDEQLEELSAQLDGERDYDLGYLPLRRGAVGERFPTPDVHATQRLEPRPPDDARFLHAILDALARIEAKGYAQLVAQGATPVSAVFSSGGGARNAVFARIRERLLGVPVRRAQSVEASEGVALLAITEGVIPD